MADAWVPTVDDYVDLAAYLLETTPEAIRRLPRIHLAESAVHAPFAGFGDRDAYPEMLDRAAVLILHLAQNHPCRTAPSERRSCSPRSTSNATAGHGQDRTSKSTPAWSSGSLRAAPRSTRSGHGSGSGRAERLGDALIWRAADGPLPRNRACWTGRSHGRFAWIARLRGPNSADAVSSPVEN